MYVSTTLIFLFIVLDILVYCLQKLQVEHDDLKDSSSLDKRSMPEEDHGEGKDSSSHVYQRCRVFSLAEIRLTTNDFDDAFVIGKGGFGNVYKGKVDLEGGYIEVAIKRSNPDSNQGVTEYRAEIETLSKFRHSHIVSLLGCCDKEMILVYEYMPNGSLGDHLHKNRANPLTWVQRLNICIGAARGLDYLHTGTDVQYRIVHRDVKSSNILLDENWTGKIADFGLSRTTPAPQSGTTTHAYTGHIMGTFGYMDAEYFSTHRLTRKSDVYAFGVVLLEVLCGRPALDFTLDEEQHSLAVWAKYCIKGGNMGQIIDPYLRGEVPANCLKKFGQIAYECLCTRSKDRPTVTMVLARLESVLTLTMQSLQRYSNTKHIAWSLFFTDVLSWKVSDSVGDSTPSQAVAQPSGKATTLILKQFTYSELKIATSDFSPDIIIGEGGFGKVYKGWLNRVTYAPQKAGDGLPVAIKRLNPDSRQGLEEWQAEMQFLGRFYHPNLVKLIGHCVEDKELLLVYEFMQKESLDKHLFRKAGKFLPWCTRIKIAIGAAQGLAFLHSTERNVICRDVQSANILLDEDFNAKLSDFALARFGPADEESYVSTRVIGTYGYGAPEYVSTGRFYSKSDVYSFGVVLAEMLIGRRAIDYDAPIGKRNTIEWVKPYFANQKKLMNIMDARLSGRFPLKAAVQVAELALMCLRLEPKTRPSMKEVVEKLEKVEASNMWK